VVRSERLIKLRDSWFSAKPISVGRLNLKQVLLFRVELLLNYGSENFTDFNKTSNTSNSFQTAKL